MSDELPVKSSAQGGADVPFDQSKLLPDSMVKISGPNESKAEAGKTPGRYMIVKFNGYFAFIGTKNTQLDLSAKPLRSWKDKEFKWSQLRVINPAFVTWKKDQGKVNTAEFNTKLLAVLERIAKAMEGQAKLLDGAPTGDLPDETPEKPASEDLPTEDTDI